jgi:hypothetical protein
MKVGRTRTPKQFTALLAGWVKDGEFFDEHVGIIQMDDADAKAILFDVVDEARRIVAAAKRRRIRALSA